jgi:hypothetical protein
MEGHNKLRFQISVKLSTGKNWLCRRKRTEYYNRHWTTSDWGRMQTFLNEKKWEDKL